MKKTRIYRLVLMSSYIVGLSAGFLLMGCAKQAPQSEVKERADEAFRNLEEQEGKYKSDHLE